MQGLPSYASPLTSEGKYGRQNSSVYHYKPATTPSDPPSSDIWQDGEYPIIASDPVSELDEPYSPKTPKRTFSSMSASGSHPPSGTPDNARSHLGFDSTPKPKARRLLNLSVNEIIEECVEHSLTNVDLSTKGLVNIPSEIKDLKNIVNLSQSYNSGIKLFLSNNSIKELPDELFEITNLQELSLRNNQLRELPASIYKLRQLTTLNLANNNISYLPATILELPRLEKLIVNSSDLVSSPSILPRSTPRKDSHAPCMSSKPSVEWTQNCKGLNQVSSLAEYAKRVLGQHMFDHDSRVVHLLHDIASIRPCHQCKGWMCKSFAIRTEFWDGFADTEDLPIKREVCSFPCLNRAPEYVENVN